MKSLKAPSLVKREVEGVSFYTDDSLANDLGVRIAFTCKTGGASSNDYAGLNLGSHVGDDLEAVSKNRELTLKAFCAPEESRLVVLDQVHGSDVIVVGASEASELEAGLVPQPAASADGVVVSSAAKNVVAMLMYADCMPVIVVSPSGAFAVAHAGWKGVMARVVGVALEKLLSLDTDVSASDLNVYIGPCIRRECFEVSSELKCRFASEFGEGVVFEESNVDLVFAMNKTLTEAGIDAARICDIGKCTVCDNAEFFSYRAQGGTCGRHSAIALRL